MKLMKNSDRQINEALDRLSASRPPSAPENVEQNVWRRIRQSTVEAAENFDWRPAFWPRWITNPAFGVGLVVASSAIGILLSTTFYSRQLAALEEGHGSSLSVFSEQAPGIVQFGLNN